MKQEKVACLIDNDATLALEAGDTYAVQVCGCGWVGTKIKVCERIGDPGKRVGICCCCCRMLLKFGLVFMGFEVRVRG